MELRLAQCLLVAKVLVADGMITPEERRFLDATLARMRLDAAERARVVELDGWDEAEKVVAQMSEDDKRELVELLLTAASVDGRLSPQEAVAVGKISRALGL